MPYQNRGDHTPAQGLLCDLWLCHVKRRAAGYNKDSSLTPARHGRGEGTRGSAQGLGVRREAWLRTPTVARGYTVLLVVLSAAKPIPMAKRRRGTALLPTDGSTCRRTGQARCQAQHPPAPKILLALPTSKDSWKEFSSNCLGRRKRH